MHNILLSLRQRKILQSLKYKTEYVTGKELANELNVSSRTIRKNLGLLLNLNVVLDIYYKLKILLNLHTS